MWKVRAQIKICEIDGGPLGALGYHAVQQDFYGVHLGSDYRRIVWILYPVPPDRKSGPELQRAVVVSLTESTTMYTVYRCIIV